MQHRGTNYFLIYHPGHGGGGTIQFAVNNHPDGMCCLGEVHKFNQLDFLGRGLDKTSWDLDQEILNYFADAEHANYRACGIIKTFRRSAVEFVLGQGGRIIQMLRNPLAKSGGRLVRLDKKHKATKLYRQAYEREPQTRAEWLDGHAMYLTGMYETFMARAHKYPILRLEDMNYALAERPEWFQALMQWLTQHEWPMEWVDYVRETALPNSYFKYWVEWFSSPDPAVGRKRVAKCGCHVDSERGVEMLRTDVWQLDPESMAFWYTWPDDTRTVYQRHFVEIERRLGYNQRFPSSVDVEWEFADTAPWGRLERRVP
jgi:hypothetical protein